MFICQCSQMSMISILQENTIKDTLAMLKGARDSECLCPYCSTDRRACSSIGLYTGTLLMKFTTQIYSATVSLSHSSLKVGYILKLGTRIKIFITA